LLVWWNATIIIVWFRASSVIATSATDWELHYYKVMPSAIVKLAWQNGKGMIYSCLSLFTLLVYDYVLLFGK
jgi:hypothetical protein